MRQRASRASVLEVGPAGVLALRLLRLVVGFWGCWGSCPGQRVGSRSPTPLVLLCPSWFLGSRVANK